MSAFNFTKLKAALVEAGHVVSEGEQLLVTDITEVYDYLYRNFALTVSQVAYGFAYPSTVPSTIPGHPDAEDKGAVQAETPKPTAAPIQPAEVIQPTIDAASTVSTDVKNTPDTTGVPEVNKEIPAPVTTPAATEVTEEPSKDSDTTTNTQTAVVEPTHADEQPVSEADKKDALDLAQKKADDAADDADKQETK